MAADKPRRNRQRAAQEALTRLETIWGMRENVFYPTPKDFASFVGPRHCAGRPGPMEMRLVEMQTFLDCGPLLVWRKNQNAQLPQPMTLSAAFLWCLARHPAFPGIYFGTTVELPAMQNLGRGVSMIVLRPADYFARKTGLSDFVKDFNHQLYLTKQRQSAACKTLDAAAYLPPSLETPLLRQALEKGGPAFGSLGVTVLKDARVFGAPMADAGHPDGFIALGSVALPTADGTTVGCIAIKGPPEKILNYPTALQEAIQHLTLPKATG